MDSDRLAEARALMVEQQLRGRGITDERVLAVMAIVPRHEFVSVDRREHAYSDEPVPIPAGQTVSQPYIVAAMIESLRLQASDKVLEIGTGTGYQAAVLSQLSRSVFTIERHETLAAIAGENLRQLGYLHVTVVVGDGTRGLPEHAPYDAIIVAAAAPRVPPALLEQLAEGGRLIIPVGSRHEQFLHLLYKHDDRVTTSVLEPCRFVPLLGEEGFEGGD
jgi:protein-L-isoaspartate(D-aspartate) O-methyltransferase